jgi:hypothetical protein
MDARNAMTHPEPDLIARLFVEFSFFLLLEEEQGDDRCAPYF